MVFDGNYCLCLWVSVVEVCEVCDVVIVCVDIGLLILEDEVVFLGYDIVEVVVVYW